LDAKRVQGPGKFNNAGFVGDGNQGVHGGCSAYFKSLCASNFLRKVLRFRPSHSAARDWF
jgi:hypothetical protein